MSPSFRREVHAWSCVVACIFGASMPPLYEQSWPGRAWELGVMFAGGALIGIAGRKVGQLIWDRRSSRSR